jgi:hypothetical protein
MDSDRHLARAGAVVHRSSPLIATNYNLCYTDDDGDDEGLDSPESWRLIDTMTPALDWMMHAPYRVAVKRLLDRGGRAPTVIAPSAQTWKECLLLDRCFIYDPADYDDLFRRGREDAIAAVPDNR